MTAVDHRNERLGLRSPCGEADVEPGVQGIDAIDEEQVDPGALHDRSVAEMGCRYELDQNSPVFAAVGSRP
jgi:hypothetical protein